MDLKTGALGAETKYDVSFSGGKLTVTATYGGTQSSASLSVTVGGDLLLKALAAKVSSPIEQEVLNGLATLLDAIP